MKTTTSTINNQINDPLLRCALTLTLFALICVGFLPEAQAVSPAPDGGYPGGNTAKGQNALLRLTTGTFNTAIGLFSVESLMKGKFNTGVGAGTSFRMRQTKIRQWALVRSLATRLAPSTRQLERSPFLAILLARAILPLASVRS